MSGILKRLLIGKQLKRTLIRAELLIVLSVAIFKFVLAPLRLQGESMQPTYQSGQLAVANRLSYLGSKPERGDVVAVRLRDSGRSVFLLKRIVGLPGETIGFENGQLIVDGVAREEPYLALESDWNRKAVSCAADEYFIVGDNRSMPISQHLFGRTKLSRIVGKVLF